MKRKSLDGFENDSRNTYALDEQNLQQISFKRPSKQNHVKKPLKKVMNNKKKILSNLRGLNDLSYLHSYSIGYLVQKTEAPVCQCTTMLKIKQNSQSENDKFESKTLAPRGI